MAVVKRPPRPIEAVPEALRDVMLLKRPVTVRAPRRVRVKADR